MGPTSNEVPEIDPGKVIRHATRVISFHQVSTMRNQPCSCGSGLKFKKCPCGRQARAEQIRSTSR